jgi:hypothetical protein
LSKRHMWKMEVKTNFSNLAGWEKLCYSPDSFSTYFLSKNEISFSFCLGHEEAQSQFFFF